MRSEAVTIRISFIVSVLSLSCCLVLHYCGTDEELSFWCNVALAVFGSSLLVLASSLIDYITARRKTLEAFSYRTNQLLRFLNKYDYSWLLGKKISFFLEYHDLDKSDWDSLYGAIYFLFDFKDNNRQYIYQSIYSPIHQLNSRVAECSFHFRLYDDSRCNNIAVMTGFVQQLEQLLNGSQDKSIEHETQLGTEAVILNQLVRTISKELNGKYYDIMYRHKQKN